jgi:hypothetical protein
MTRIGAALAVLLTAAVGNADQWYGTAPFCAGSCPSGWQELQRLSCCGSNSAPGCGACCWTGNKVLCRQPGSNPGLACTPRTTQTTCYGVILVCNDGYYNINGSYTTCNSYACGICFGFGSW